MTKAESRAKYLERAMALASQGDVESILALRRHRLDALGAAAAMAPHDWETDGAERSELEDQLAHLRESFWDTPVEKRKAALTKLKADAFPDLDQSRVRLLAVAAVDADIAAAQDHADVDPMFFSAMRGLLIAPEPERAELKRWALAALRKRSLRKAAIRSARAMEQVSPGVVALEPEWFAAVRKSKRWVADGRPVMSTQGVILLIFAIFVGLPLLIDLFLAIVGFLTD